MWKTKYIPEQDACTREDPGAQTEPVSHGGLDGGFAVGAKGSRGFGAKANVPLILP